MKNKISNKTLQGIGILSFSLERWHSVWRSRHHIMSALAQDNPVLFTSSPFYIRDVLSTKGRAAGDAERTGLSRIQDQLSSYLAPRWLPTLYRFPAIDNLFKKLRTWHLKRTLQQVGIVPDIIYIWHPSFADHVDDFDQALVVYHCYDEYSAFDPDHAAHDPLTPQECALLQRADIVFAVSEKVRQRRLPFNANIHVVSNGVDYPLFSKAQDADTRIPDDLRGIQGPIIGLVTTLTSITDIALLHAIFERRPDWSFVFIGLETDATQSSDEALRHFVQLPNVHVIGRRSLQEIPAYLKGCDVCTIPWLLNELSLSGSPLKLYEYLAAGKPVVSTPLAHLLFLAEVIAFAQSADEWIVAIEAALRHESPGSLEARQHLARENTWEKKVDFISQQLVLTQKKLNPSQVRGLAGVPKIQTSHHLGQNQKSHTTSATGQVGSDSR